MHTPAPTPSGASRRLMLALIALGATSAFGQSDWTGDISQDWNDFGNWSSSPAAPSGHFHINISTGNYPALNTDSVLSPVDIFIGSNGGSGRLDHSAGLLSAGPGNWSFVGTGAGSSGVYTMTGSSSFTSGRLVVGLDGGTGTMNINTTGTVNTNTPSGDWWANNGLAIGVDAGSTGTVNLQAGIINTGGGSNGNLWVGALDGHGILNQTGGTINTVGLSIGR